MTFNVTQQSTTKSDHLEAGSGFARTVRKALQPVPNLAQPSSVRRDSTNSSTPVWVRAVRRSRWARIIHGCPASSRRAGAAVRPLARARRCASLHSRVRLTAVLRLRPRMRAMITHETGAVPATAHRSPARRRPCRFSARFLLCRCSGQLARVNRPSKANPCNSASSPALRSRRRCRCPRWLAP